MCRLLKQFLRTAFIASVLWQPCEGADFGVGGDGTWGIQVDQYYYQAWANGVKFQVGDTIGFVYDNTYYDVRSVPSATALENCDFSKSTIRGATGNTVVPLSVATTYYFVSQLGCSYGMSFQAIVTNATSPRSPPLPGFVIPPPPPEGSSFGIPAFVPPEDNFQQEPKSGSGSHIPAVVGGTTGGVVGLGAIVSILYYFRDICRREKRPSKMQHTSQSPAHLHQSPAHLHQSPTHAGVGGQNIPDWGSNMNSWQVPGGETPLNQGQFYQQQYMPG